MTLLFSTFGPTEMIFFLVLAFIVIGTPILSIKLYLKNKRLKKQQELLTKERDELKNQQYI